MTVKGCWIQAPGYTDTLAKWLLAGMVCFTCCLSNSVAQSNEGTEFWFGFMEHIDVNANEKVAMITSKYFTSGTISMPRQNWRQSFTVAANQVTIIQLPTAAETVGSEKIDSTGILVLTQQPASVYIHQYHASRSEAAMVLPVNSLGRSYYVLTYTGVINQGRSYPSEFLVVATQDETQVSIRLRDRTLGGKTAGSAFSITLNAGQTYQVQAATGDGDLSGTFVEGDKDFALFAGNSWTEVPTGCNARDNLLEQMYPVDSWGKKFVTAPNANVAYDVFRILASEHDTQVSVEVVGGPTQHYTLQAGAFTEYRLSAGSLITANHPILVAQYNIGSGCSGHTVGDPSMVLLNSVEQTRDTVTLYNSSFQQITENYINIIARTVDIDSLVVDGAPLRTLGVSPQTVGQDKAFAYARLRVAAGAHTIFSKGCGVMATAYGYGSVESYAYGGGASFKKINANPIPDGGCLNDSIFFDTGLSPQRYSFLWDFGNGETVREAKFTRRYTKLGAYPVTLSVKDECLNTTDTLKKTLQITLRKAVQASEDVTACEKGPFELTATDLPGARYEWRGPNDFLSETQTIRIDEARPNMSGSYAVIGIVSGCATYPAFTEVEIIPSPKPNLGRDTIFCTDEDFPPTLLYPGDFARYYWQDGSTQPDYTVRKEGIFRVEVQDEYGCTGMDSVRYTEQCPTRLYVPNAFSPDGDQVNDTFGPYGTDIIAIDLRIFDRWGNLVFESNTPEGHWDGTWRGQPASPGVYAWVIQLTGARRNGKVFREVRSGTVTLVR